TRVRDNQFNHYQYDRNYIVRSVEASLKNLKTDHLDLLLLHRPSPLMDPGEIAGAILPLLESGKILEFGVSNFSPSQIALLETALPVSGYQIEFSLTHTEPMYDGSLDVMMALTRLAMAWSPLGACFREENART